jgi:hypothetical protein
MVRRAGFWRDVAIMAALQPYLKKRRESPAWKMEMAKQAIERLAGQVLACDDAVKALTRDGLSAPPASETTGAAERTEIQWLDKGDVRDGDAS